MDDIRFDDYELDRLSKATGLSRLELLGVIAEINRIHGPKVRSRRKYEEDERMGRDI